jgi:formate/nitrite transporter
MLVGSVSGLYSVGKLVMNWVIVYFGNFLGAVAYTYLVYKAGLFGDAAPGFSGVAEPNQLGLLAVSVSEAKLSLSFAEALIRGYFCNMLVLLAIIMAAMAKDITAKILSCIIPVTAFVAIGFEHSIANMFLIPIGLLIKGAAPAELASMFRNIIPVTIGNILGGVFILFIHPNRIRQIATFLRRK